MSAHRLPQDLYKAIFDIPDQPIGTSAPGPSITYDRFGETIGMVIGSSGAEYQSLPDPVRAGQVMRLTVYSVGSGTRVIKANGKINSAGNSKMTFATARQTIVLESVPAPNPDNFNSTGTTGYLWTITLNDGTVTLGT